MKVISDQHRRDWRANVLPEDDTVERVYATKHSTEWHRKIAEDNLILRVEVGSTLHGVTVKTADDIDEMGVCIEPPDVIMGISYNDAPLFEQYEYRTQPVGARSGPGDIDRTIYSLRKYARMIAQGNPTCLMPLYADEDKIRYINAYGAWLRRNRKMFLSKQAGERFSGYLDNQIRRYLSGRGEKTTRPELIEAYGWDTKAGYHALRITIQGAQLMTNHDITLPMEPDHVQLLTDVRNGVYTKQQVLDMIADRNEALIKATKASSLPSAPNYSQLSVEIARLYRLYWGSQYPIWTDVGSSVEPV